MNQQQKKKFIRELCNSVRDELISKVGRMPKEWDGLELRELVERKFDDETVLTKRARSKYVGGEYRNAARKRLRSFNADYYSSNL